MLESFSLTQETFWKENEVKKIVALFCVFAAVLVLGQPETSKGGAVAGCGGVAVADCAAVATNDCGGSAVKAGNCRGRVARVRGTHIARTRTVSRNLGSNCHGQNVVEQKSVTRVRRAIVAQPVRTALNGVGTVLNRCASTVGCGLNTVGVVVAADAACDSCEASCDACVVRVPRRIVTKSFVVNQSACKSCDAAEPTCAATEPTCGAVADPTCAAPAQPTPPAEDAPSAPVGSGT